MILTQVGNIFVDNFLLIIRRGTAILIEHQKGKGEMEIEGEREREKVVKRRAIPVSVLPMQTHLSTQFPQDHIEFPPQSIGNAISWRQGGNSRIEMYASRSLNQIYGFFLSPLRAKIWGAKGKEKGK